MLGDLTTIDTLSYAAAAATLYSFFAKTMVPLRSAAIAANVFFIGYSAAKGVYATLILHAVLLPLNVQRLRAMQRLTRSVQAAAATGDFSMDWLRSYMKARSYPAGAVMFRKGDPATEAFHLVGGDIRLEEIGVRIGPGTFFGEMGLFTTDNRRTVTARCETEVRVLFITYDEFRQLYFQQPSFGFYVLRLIVSRMEKNLELARQVSAPGPSALPAPAPEMKDDAGARRPAEEGRLL